MKAANEDTFQEMADFKFDKGIVLKVPLQCGWGTTIGRWALGAATFGVRKWSRKSKFF